MSPRTRRLIVIGIGVALALLVSWDLYREYVVRACTDSGGAWDGRASRCWRSPGPIIIERDIKRT